jgi:hypothetical protein
MKLNITFPSEYNPYQSKIEVIKYIRTLTGLGLKQSKDTVETMGPQVLDINPARLEGTPMMSSDYERELKHNGCVLSIVGTTVIDDLRAVAIKALQCNDDAAAFAIINLLRELA